MKRVVTVCFVAHLSFSFAQDREGWPELLRFGLLPREESTVDDQYGLFFEHLSEELAIPVEYFVGSDYAAIIVAMSTGRVEAAWFGPESYVIATENAEAEAVAVSDHVTNGTGYFSGIWTYKGSGIETLEDAQGKDFAFVDPASTSGYLVPTVHFLRDLEMNPNDFFGRIAFSGNHGASLLALDNGNLDAAAISFNTVENTIREGQIAEDELLNLWKSDLIPGSPIAVRGDLPDSFKKAFQEALLSFDSPEGLAEFTSNGFVATDDSAYDPIRALNEVKEQLQN